MQAKLQKQLYLTNSKKKSDF